MTPRLLLAGMLVALAACADPPPTAAALAGTLQPSGTGAAADSTSAGLAADAARVLEAEFGVGAVDYEAVAAGPQVDAGLARLSFDTRLGSAGFVPDAVPPAAAAWMSAVYVRDRPSGGGRVAREVVALATGPAARGGYMVLTGHGTVSAADEETAGEAARTRLERLAASGGVSLKARAFAAAGARLKRLRRAAWAPRWAARWTGPSAEAVAVAAGMTALVESQTNAVLEEARTQTDRRGEALAEYLAHLARSGQGVVIGRQADRLLHGDRLRTSAIAFTYASQDTSRTFRANALRLGRYQGALREALVRDWDDGALGREAAVRFADDVERGLRLPPDGPLRVDGDDWRRTVRNHVTGLLDPRGPDGDLLHNLDQSISEQFMWNWGDVP